MVKLRRMRWTGHVTYIAEKRALVGKQKDRDHHC
jgi:hypothetical protein